MKKSLKNMAVICLTIGTLTLGSSFAVFAADTSISTTTAATTTSQSQNYNKKHEGKMQSMNVDSLVTAGIIDQTTADAITAYITELQTERKAEMEKVKSMTASEKKAYFESKKSETKTSLLDQLVCKGIITQTQEDAIKAAQPQKDHSKATQPQKDHSKATQPQKDHSKATQPQKNQSKDKKGNRMNKLDVSALVTDGVIDQTTADGITAYVTKIQTEQKAEMEKVKSMTASEKKAYFESKKSTTKTSLLDELVSESIITQDQATAIKSAVSTHKTRTPHKVTATDATTD